MADEWLEMALDLGLITAHGMNNAGLHCVRWIGGEVTTLEWAMYCHRISELQKIHSTKKQETTA